MRDETMSPPSYQLDGREARGDAHITAIDALDHRNPDFLIVSLADSKWISVSPTSDGWGIEESHSDGSSWMTETPMTKDDIKRVVANFVDGKSDWAAGLEWYQVALPPRESRRRVLRLILVGVALIVIVYELFR